MTTAGSYLAIKIVQLVQLLGLIRGLWNKLFAEQLLAPIRAEFGANR